jgi:excinuclease UvrABC nuclease subunit
MRQLMAQIPDILQQQIGFDPEGDFDLFLKGVPAKWVVYLLVDGEDQPLQLLCVKNLRYSLKRRLGGEENLLLSKRVNYRQIVRKIFWRRVDSAFEADWIYHELARKIFPQTYQGMVGFRPAWFLHVNPEAEFPRYVKTIDLVGKPGVYLGPLDDKHAAARLIELLEDSFDLCRYYNILVESPNARACAYKEMGKCPAPCDGTISLPQYRRMIEWSLRTVTDPREFVREQTKRMEAAAGELRFEIASKIKTYIAQICEFGKGAYRHVRKLEDFALVAFQPGPRAGSAKIFLILRGKIGEICNLIGEPSRPSEVMGVILEAADRAAGSISTDAEQIGIVSHHLFAPKQTAGVFLPLADISEKAIGKAYRDLSKQKFAEEVEGEGVVKELQAM